MYENITNHYSPIMERPKLQTQQFTLQDPTDKWRFAHHPRIGYFKGRYYVIFSTGYVNEDDVGQHVRYCTSEDFEHWTEPRVLVPAYKGKFREGVSSPAGLYDAGDRLICYFNQSEYKEEALENGLRTYRSGGREGRGFKAIWTYDGENWSEPVDVAESFGSNHSPIKLKNGRLLYSGSFAHPYSDNPNGIDGWVVKRAFPAGYPQSMKFEDGEGVFTETGVVSNNKVGLCEGSFVQTEGGVIYMFYRSGTDYLWAAESHDNGESWTLPQPTKFTDNRTKFHLGRLPNGRFYYVGTPDPFPPRTRHVLALSLSDDGLDYNRHFLIDDTQYKGRYPGIDKNGIYGYPSTLVHDGYMNIAASICKEKIIVIRFPIDSL